MIQSKKFKGELGKGTQRNFLNCKIEDTRLNNIQYTKLESSFRKMNIWLREVSERKQKNPKDRLQWYSTTKDTHCQAKLAYQLPAMDGERRSQREVLCSFRLLG